MDAPSPGFPFRWFLPMIQLLVCIVVLQPYWSIFRSEVARDIETYWESLLGTNSARPQPATVFNVTPEPPTQPPIDPRLTIPAALNLPIGFVQLPFVFFSDDKAEWAPEGMLQAEWRALSWPFVGMIFWWMAGRGLEAFSAAVGRGRFAIIRPALHRIEVAIGLILFLAGGAAGVLYAVGRDPSGLMTDRVFVAGAGLWAVLGAAIVVARLLQGRIRRRARVEGVAYVP